MSLLGDILKIAVGAAVGDKEGRKQTRLLEEAAKREEARDRQAANDRYNARVNHNIMRSNIIKENQERIRKGQPTIPIPPEMY
jgi:hypothetical protein